MTEEKVKELICDIILDKTCKHDIVGTIGKVTPYLAPKHIMEYAIDRYSIAYHGHSTGILREEIFDPIDKKGIYFSNFEAGSSKYQWVIINDQIVNIDLSFKRSLERFLLNFEFSLKDVPLTKLIRKETQKNITFIDGSIETDRTIAIVAKNTNINPEKLTRDISFFASIDFSITNWKYLYKLKLKYKKYKFNLFYKNIEEKLLLEEQILKILLEYLKDTFGIEYYIPYEFIMKNDDLHLLFQSKFNSYTDAAGYLYGYNCLSDEYENDIYLLEDKEYAKEINKIMKDIKKCFEYKDFQK